jgi:hypothetical protein
MAFVLPNFNLTCNIHSVVAGVHTFRLGSPCNLALGRRTGLILGAGVQDNGFDALTPSLLLPALTDIRDSSCGGEMDIVEVPAGTGRWYLVAGVDDIGKGFANEHRVATLFKTWGFPGNGSGLTAPWPTPIP